MRTEDAFKVRLANCSRIILVHTGQFQEHFRRRETYIWNGRCGLGIRTHLESPLWFDRARFVQLDLGCWGSTVINLWNMEEVEYFE